jgi:hypothetical protein
MCWSHLSALAVRQGSMAIRRAPRRFASCQAPEVEVGDDAVGAPEDDQPRIDDIFGSKPMLRRSSPDSPLHRRWRRSSGRVARRRDGERSGGPSTRSPADRSCRRSCRERSLGATFSGDAAEALGDGGQRLFPGDALESCAGTLGADPAQRVQQAVGMIDALGVEGDLGAQHPGRRG